MMVNLLLPKCLFMSLALWLKLKANYGGPNIVIESHVWKSITNVFWEDVKSICD
jgi:hypothetical protein